MSTLKPASWSYAEDFVPEPEVMEQARARGLAFGAATPVGIKKKKGKRLREKNKLYATRVSKNAVTAQIKNTAIYAAVVEWGWDGKGRNSFMRATVKRLNEQMQNKIRLGAIQQIERKAAKLGVK